MPRKPRFYLPGVPVHVVQRGNDRQAVFFVDEDYTAYLSWLREGAERHGCLIHAYVLMTNHVHLLLTPQSRDSISRTIQFLGRNYVGYINHLYQRSGTLWEGRYRATVVESQRCLLVLMRYIELNPVSAGMVNHPKDYLWSSYRYNALGDKDANTKWLVPHAEYRRLGKNDSERQPAYRHLFRSAISGRDLKDIRENSHKGWAAGNQRFRDKIEALSNR